MSTAAFDHSCDVFHRMWDVKKIGVRKYVLHFKIIGSICGPVHHSQIKSFFT